MNRTMNRTTQDIPFHERHHDELLTLDDGSCSDQYSIYVPTGDCLADGVLR